MGKLPYFDWPLYKIEIESKPDMYVGSIEPVDKTMWILSQEKTQFLRKNISFIPALYKIFDEILVNAADNKVLLAIEFFFWLGKSNAIFARNQVIKFSTKRIKLKARSILEILSSIFFAWR